MPASVGVLLLFATVLVVLLAGPVAAQVAAADWTQYQGGAGHPGSIAQGPQPPYALGHVFTFDDLPGGSSESLGLSPPVVVGTAGVLVGPTSVRRVDLSTGAADWTVTREFGPSVSAAIGAASAFTGSCSARCEDVVLYTEGWGAGPGDPTSSATPTTSVRPGLGSSATASVTPAASTTPSASITAGGTSGPGIQTGRNSQLIARTLRDGSKAWDAPVLLKATSRTGVTVDGATAFVGDIQGNVYAVDVATGKQLWTANVNGFLESPIAAADGTLLVAVDGHSTDSARLVALSETTGKVSWVYDTNHPGFLTSPSVSEGLAFVAVTSSGPTGPVPSLVAVDIADGGSTWESQVSAPVTFATAPVVAGDRVFIEDTYGDVFAIDRASGDRDWMFATNTRFAQGAPLVIGGAVLVPTDVGSLIVLDAATGHQVFRSADAGGPLRYGAAIGTDRFVFTRGGPKPGLVTFTGATSRSGLTDIPSPTTANYGKIFGNFAIAAAALVLVSLAAFRPLARRMGPAFLLEDDDVPDGGEEDL